MGINGPQMSKVDYMLIDQVVQITKDIDLLKKAVSDSKKTGEILAVVKSLYAQLNLVAPSWIYYHYGWMVLKIASTACCIIEQAITDVNKPKHKKLKQQQVLLANLYFDVEPNCKTHERTQGHDGAHRLSQDRFEFFGRG